MNESQNKSDLHHMAMHTPLRTEIPINSYVLVQYENLEHKPWSSVRRNEVLHEYLKMNGLQRFIPREFFD